MIIAVPLGKGDAIDDFFRMVVLLMSFLVWGLVGVFIAYRSNGL